MVPEAMGGMGQSVSEAALVAEEMGRGQVLEPYAACGILPLRLLTAFPLPQTEALVSAAVAGKAIVAVAHSEPQARGNVCDIAVSARRVGARWQISGRKSLVVGAPAADWFIVSART